MFELQFPLRDVPRLAERYVLRQKDIVADEQDARALAAATQGRQDGYLTKEAFLTLCRWKSVRLMGHARKNRSAFVREATAVSFTAKCEELRAGALLTLDRVGWPMASAILHLVHENKYPLLDFRALWSLGIPKVPTYTFAFWWAYVEACRRISREAHVDMRTLDRALWQYSFEHQKEVQN